MKTLTTGFILGFLLMPTSLATLALLGRLPVAAISSAPDWESRLARRAVVASLRRNARRYSPMPVDDADLLAGMRTYRNACAGCHGDLGQPSAWGTGGFYPRVPQFAEHPSTLSIPEMYVAVKQGIRYSGMGAWKDLLTDDEIWRVVTFVGRMRSLPPAVEDAWKAKPTP
jgi:mono/diheme cytochrome c family protein